MPDTPPDIARVFKVVELLSVVLFTVALALAGWLLAGLLPPLSLLSVAAWAGAAVSAVAYGVELLGVKRRAPLNLFVFLCVVALQMAL